MTDATRKSVVVTGAAGFIGAHLVRRLSVLGNEVHALDNRSVPAHRRFDRACYQKVDIRDVARVAAIASGVDTVFHLASTHLDVRTAPQVFEEVNIHAARDLVAALAACGVRRLVHTSSVGIYGHVAAPPARENSPKHPHSVYERTKLAGEEAVLRRAEEVGLDVVVLRPAWVYGPGCPRTAKLIRTLSKGRFVYVGTGENLRHPIFIDDMVDAFLLAQDAPRLVAGRPYIIAGPRSMTLREMVETFARMLGVPAPRRRLPTIVGWGLGLGLETAYGLVRRDPPFSRRSLAFFQNDAAFDTTAASSDLRFRARVDLEEGIRRTLGNGTAANRGAAGADGSTMSAVP